MNIEEQLKRIIKDKRVAIVGPADYVNKELDSTHGEYIDNSFDVIIRVNGLIYIKDKELEKYYGSKYNILFSSFWNLPEDIEEISKNKKHNDRYLDLESYQNIKEKTILFECYARNLFNKIYNVYRDTIESKNIYYGNSSVNFYRETLEFMNKISPINSTPTTGTLTIIMVLLMKPKKLYVTGITSYLDLKHNAYFDCYLTQNNNVNVVEKLRGNKTINKNEYFNGKTYNFNHPIVNNHPFKSEQNILKYLVTNKFIKVDKYLKKLVKQ